MNGKRNSVHAILVRRGLIIRFGFADDADIGIQRGKWWESHRSSRVLFTLRAWTKATFSLFLLVLQFREEPSTGDWRLRRIKQCSCLSKSTQMWNREPLFLHFFVACYNTRMILLLILEQNCLKNKQINKAYKISHYVLSLRNIHVRDSRRALMQSCLSISSASPGRLQSGQKAFRKRHCRKWASSM